MILHAHKLGPSPLLSDELHRRKLHCPHTARADVAHFPALDQVVQRFHCLFDRHSLIEAVDLEEVDVWRVEPCERGIDGVEYGDA